MQVATAQIIEGTSEENAALLQEGAFAGRHSHRSGMPVLAVDQRS